MVRGMKLSSAQIIEGLGGLLGEAEVIGDVAQMDAYLIEPRKRFKTPAVAVARPADVPQLQALVRWANTNEVPLIPQGGNTGLVGAQVPLNGTEVIVSLTRLNKVRSVDAAAGNMTLEAGVILEEAHQAAEAAGAMFPLWIASPGLGADRRRAVVERRRGAGAGVRQCARTLPRDRGGAAGWAPVPGAQRAEKGQYRLRPQGSADRRRRDARVHHGGDAETLPAAGGL